MASFTTNEIRKAVKELQKNKAPGLDGFTAEFSIKLWDKLKDIFMNFFKDFYGNGKLNSCVKGNFICLIQKKEDAVLVKDFRPISLTTIV